MNIHQARTHFETSCSSVLAKEESDAIFKRVLEHFTGKTQLQLRMHPEIKLDTDTLQFVIAAILQHKPIQYILGNEWFHNLNFEVNQHVLIPRPETEELVQWILQSITKENIPHHNVLDIGTGSGCIPIVLKKHLPHSAVTGIDISPNALAVAAKNASTHQVQIQWLEADILNSRLELPTSYDLIVSNPPYITLEEQAEMDERVMGYEPHVALFVSNNDPLQFYKAILQTCTQSLTSNGTLFLELNQDYATETEQLYKQHGFETALKKDLYGHFRFLKVKKKPAF